MTMKRYILPIIAMAFLAATAEAKTVTLRVDAQAAPWRTGSNPKLAFGLADARSPALLVDTALLPGITLHVTATGLTTTVTGGGSYGPEGQSDWIADRGMALFPSYYIEAKGRVAHLNELVGAFVDADGKVVGKPFLIGSAANVPVPDGAAGLSLGINDDRYSDNSGSLTVTIVIPEAKVIVE
ncbi:MAG: hypothetical protein PGN16_06745 [Sphingomonas phyllosphaerae]|uniref:hypothetical protein n=1 Tax=Sphingomonas phyllosphaerae TaxID=257003 RepID=UPI002FF77321